MPKKRRQKLSTRQQLLVKNLAKGKTQAAAAVAAGYTSKHAGQAGHQALQQIQKTAPELLAKHGLSDDVLIEKYLTPLMRADRSVFAVSEGEFTDERKRPDWNARNNGLDMAFKIRGLYVREAENKGPEFNVIIIDSAHRPDWAAMRKAQPKIDVPGLTVPPPQE